MTGCAILDSGIAARKNGKRLPCEALQADNAKLRELVKRMSDRVKYECRCCSVFCSDWDEDNECCVFTTLMRELGVEADDFDATPAERHKGYDWYLRLRELGVEVDA